MEEGWFISLTRSEHLEKNLSQMQFSFDPQYYLGESFKAYISTQVHFFTAEWVSFYRWVNGSTLHFSDITCQDVCDITLSEPGRLLSVSEHRHCPGGHGILRVDTFWVQSESQYNTCAAGFEVHFPHKAISQAVWSFNIFWKKNFKFCIEVEKRNLNLFGSHF